MNQSDWDLLVLQYLREKGYKEAEQALERSLQINEPGSMALTDRLAIHKGVVAQLVANFATADQPAIYVDAMDRFAVWLDNSLDMYRGELSRLLYPLLLHAYLALVGKDASSQAATLLNKFRRRMIAMDGPLSRRRAAELQELQGVAVKQHLSSNSFARQVLSSKHTVRLSPYAHDLLMHFLLSNPSMLCLASLINQYVNLEVAEVFDQSLGTEAGDDELNMDGSTAEPVNNQPIQLGLLKGCIEDRYYEQEEAKQQEEQQQKGAAAAAAADGVADKAEGSKEQEAAAGQGDGATPATKKAKKSDAKSGAANDAPATQQPAIQRLHPGDRVEPQAWTPQLSDSIQQAWMTDIAARDNVGPSHLPSCCFFTFANTRQSLNCAAFTRSANMVAAGFADSSVRLYDLAKMAASSHSSGGKAAGKQTPNPSNTAMDIDDDDTSIQGITYLYGHTGPVHTVDFTHDARLLLSGSGDGSVRLWSTDLGTGLAVFRGHVLPVWDLAVGPQGYHFATGSADRSCRIWATDAVRSLRVLAGHQADVDVVRWHPNCHYVATASADRSVRLWDVASGANVRFMRGLQAVPTSMAVHPDGKHIAVGCERGMISVWDLGSAKRLTSFKAHHGPIWSLSYSQGQGTLLASGGADETVRVWSMQGGDTSTPVAEVSHNKYHQVVASHTKSSCVTHLQFSNRNLLLAAGAFNLKSKQPVKQLQ